MPSGVLFVNEIDSLYLQFVTYVYNEIARRDIFTTVAVQGDDQVLVTSYAVSDAAGEFEKYSKIMNLEANALKQ